MSEEIGKIGPKKVGDPYSVPDTGPQPPTGDAALKRIGGGGSHPGPRPEISDKLEIFEVHELHLPRELVEVAGPGGKEIWREIAELFPGGPGHPPREIAELHGPRELAELHGPREIWPPREIVEIVPHPPKELAEIHPPKEIWPPREIVEIVPHPPKEIAEIHPPKEIWREVVEIMPHPPKEIVRELHEIRPTPRELVEVAGPRPHEPGPGRDRHPIERPQPPQRPSPTPAPESKPEETKPEPKTPPKPRSSGSSRASKPKPPEHK